MKHAQAKTAKPEGQTEKASSLRVSQPGDSLELEADRVAEEVLRGPVTGSLSGAAGRPPVQRKCAACEAGGAPCPACSLSVGLGAAAGASGQLQRRPGAAAKPVANGSVKAVQAVRSGGSPLSDTARNYFEPRFRQDFSRVRIHTGSDATDVARSLNARAFTVGRDVVFGKGEFNPTSSGGRRLLAHELAHTIQQSSDSISDHGGTIALQKAPDSEEDADNLRIEEYSDVEVSYYDVLEQWETKAVEEKESKEHAYAMRMVLLLEGISPNHFETIDDFIDFYEWVTEVIAWSEKDTLLTLGVDDVTDPRLKDDTEAFPTVWSLMVEKLISPPQQLTDDLSKIAKKDYKIWHEQSTTILSKHLAEEGLPLGFGESLKVRNADFIGMHLRGPIILNGSQSIYDGDLELDELKKLFYSSALPEPIKLFGTGMIQWFESAAQ